MPNYEITVGDIKAYLAGLGPDEPAGITNDQSSCLVARALSKKYAGVEDHFIVGMSAFTTPKWEEPWHDLPGDIAEIVSKFDALSPDEDFVSRRRVEQAIPELAEGENE